MSDSKVHDITGLATLSPLDELFINDVSDTTSSVDGTSKKYAVGIESGFVGTTDTQTLTGKTLTTPVIASFYQDAAKTKLMTVPNTASDTLVALAATQTLTGKTLTTPVINGAVTGTITPPKTFYSTFTPPEGYLINGKIVPSVASNNLTVALKGKDGNDPSATNPVYVMIGGVVRSITAALTYTLPAGGSTGKAGSAELATKEIDWFPYLCWKASDSSWVFGWSRIPYATVYGDFSATQDDQNYLARNATPAATDDVIVIGRFAATQSAGAGYTWTVPTFTATNLIQRSIYETRWLDWVPVLTGGATDFSTYTIAKYKLINKILFFEYACTGATMSGSAGSAESTLPFKGLASADHVIAIIIFNGAAWAPAMCRVGATTPKISWYKTTAEGNWVANETAVQVFLKWFYEI